MLLTVFEGLPSSGKTEMALDRIAKEPGKYIFSMPQIEFMSERAARIEEKCSEAGAKTPAFAFINNEEDDRKNRSISRRIEDIPQEFASHAHVVVFITHVGMIGADFGPSFSDWIIYCDEIPSSTKSGWFSTPSCTSAVIEHYRLSPLGNGNSRVEQIKTLHSGDPLMATFGEFEHCLRSRMDVVIMGINDWSEITGSTKRVNWHSSWSLKSLEHFQEVVFMAANFTTSLLYKITEKSHPDITINRFSLPWRRRNCTVRIHFYAAHSGSTSFWENDEEGLECMNRVCRDLKERDVGFWSGNKFVTKSFHVGGLPRDRKVSPKLAGTNSLRDRASCAMIYSAKETPSDAPLREAYGLTSDDFADAREAEDIFQFTTRGAPRDPNFTGVYDIYVYEKAQAERLAAKWAPMVAAVEVVAEAGAGLMDYERHSGRRKSAKEKTKQSDAKRRAADAERKREKRRAEREAKIASGDDVKRTKRSDVERRAADADYRRRKRQAEREAKNTASAENLI